MQEFLRYLGAFLLVLALILVRKFEGDLFYDPFLAYFKISENNRVFPDFDRFKLLWNIVFRYFLNALISLGIIYFLFRNIGYVKFAGIVLLIFLVVLLPVYDYMVMKEFKVGMNIGFYVRRFLIQPMLLLVLTPAFYYQNSLRKSNPK